jgi:Tfp pilus assembly protein PilF
LKGRALNVLAEHNPDGEQFLSKAIKLDTNLLSAWNELGFCYWKRGDVSGAKNCFLKNVSCCKKEKNNYVASD